MNIVSTNGSEQSLPLAGSSSASMPRVQSIPLDQLRTLRLKSIKTSKVDGPPETAQVLNLKAKLRNPKDGTLREEIHTIEKRPEDVIDLAYFYRSPASAPLLAVLRRGRPATTFPPRPYLDSTGVMLNLPGSYINPSKGDNGLRGCVERLSRDRFNLPAPAHLSFLRGGYIPNQRGSLELVYMRAAELPEEVCKDLLLLDSTFLEGASLEWMRADEIIKRYMAREIRDPRLVEAAIRVSWLTNHPLSIPAEMEQVINLGTEHTHNSLTLPIRSAQEVVSRLQHKVLGSGWELTSLTPEEKSTEAPFITAFRGHAEPQFHDGRPSGGYDFDVVQQPDEISCLCFFFAQTLLGIEPFIVVTEGDRTARQVRKSLPFMVNTSLELKGLEGVSQVLETPLSPSEVATLMPKMVTDITGSVPIQSMYFGIDFPSPGFCTRAVHRFLCQIDPRMLDTHSAYAISLRDALLLQHTGYFRELDPLIPLLANATLPLKELHEIQANDLSDFLSVVDDEAHTFSWAQRTASAVHQQLYQLAEYRKLMIHALNHGAEIVAPDHPLEKHHFDPSMDYIVVHPEDPTIRRFHLLPHDCFHEAMRRIASFQVSGTSVSFIPYETFARADMEVEVESLWYSDVLLIQRFGIEKWDEMAGEVSIAGLLELAEIRGYAAERAAIQSMIIHNTVPPEITAALQKSPRHQEYLKLIEEKLTGYHQRDTQNTRRLYDFWKSHPLLCHAAAEFPDRIFTNTEGYLRSFRDRFMQILENDEGYNPLKHLVGAVQGNEVYKTHLSLALCLSFNQQEKLDGHLNAGKVERVNALMKELKACYDELSEMWSMIENIDPTDKNLLILKNVRRFQHGSIRDAQNLLKELTSDVGFVGERGAAYFRGRFAPASPTLEFHA